MSERNKQLVHRFYNEVMNAGNFDAVDELCAEDFVEHDPMFPVGNREGVKTAMADFRQAFPDLHIEAIEIVAEGDKVIAYSKISGTQKGEFMGMPASGKRFETTCADIVRIGEDGKAVEHWGVTDSMAMAQQLGMAPSP